VILNDFAPDSPTGARDRTNVLHWSGCPDLALANTNADKYYFGSIEQALDALSSGRRYREGVEWCRCEKCGGRPAAER
jgi:hypothetical protein